MVLLSLCAYRQRKFPVLLHHIVLAPLVFALTQRRELSEATQASSAMVTAVIRRIRLAIVAVVILFVAVPSAWACAPLVVFIGGFDEKPSKGKGAREVWIEEMKRYRDTGKNIKTLFFSWDSECTYFFELWNRRFWNWECGTISEAISHHWNSTNKHTPIILVGYSYGGDTAYRLARWTVDHYRPLLVTLDPVGEYAWSEPTDRWVLGYPLWNYFNDSKITAKRDNDLPYTGGIWYNVYTRYDRGQIYDTYKLSDQADILRKLREGRRVNCDKIAWAGGYYGYQKQATENIRHDGGHCSVSRMFDQVREKIDDHIWNKCRWGRSPRNR